MNLKRLAPVAPALSAVIGIALGAALQYLSSRSVAANEHMLELRTNVYRDFLNGQTRLQKAEAYHDSVRLKEANLLIRDATLRIAVFSKKDVAEAVAVFIAADSVVNNCGFKSQTDFDSDIGVYRAMRREVQPAAEAVDNQVLSLLVLGCVYVP